MKPVLRHLLGLLWVVMLCLVAGPALPQEKRGGLSEEEYEEYLELKDFRPRPSEGYKAWFFDFGRVHTSKGLIDVVEEGYNRIVATDLYSPEKGWGWIYDTNHVKLKDQKTWPPWPRADVGTPYGDVYIGHFRKYLFQRKYDIFTPLDKDAVLAFRKYSLGVGDVPDAGDIKRSFMGAQYMKDDVVAEFAVDVPNGDYSVLLERSNAWWASFYVQVENEAPHRLHHRTDNPKAKFMYAQVKDGQLNFRFQADRTRTPNSGLWAYGVGWDIAYIAVFQAPDEQGLYREDWRIIKDKFFTIKKEIYVNVNRLQSRIEGDHIVVDERPHFNVHLQNHSAPAVDRYLKFYSLGNTIGGGATGTVLERVFRSNNFLASDRHERAYYEDYPFELVNLANVNYKNQFFVRPSFGARQLEFMPKYLQGESPLMSSPDGRSLGRAPLGSQLQRELIREFLEFLAAHMGDHPSLMSYELWEELEDLSAYFGYDSESISTYHRWLKKKYGTLQKLNAAWKTQYAAFDEIQPPPYKIYGGANYTNWQNFRGKIVGKDLEVCYEKIRELQPNTLSVGGGARPTTGDECTWDWLPAVDATFQYGTWLKKMMYPAVRYYARKGHRVSLMSKTIKAGSSGIGGKSRNCPYTHFFGGVYRKAQKIRGRKSKQRTPRETQIAVDSCNGYHSVFHPIFHGFKSIIWEAQSLFADTHMIHYAKWYRDTLAKPYGEFRNEYNDLIFFAPQALEGPAVRICLPFLYVQRGIEAAFRLAPVMLPATPLDRVDVGLVATGESTFAVSTRPARSGLRAFRIPLNNLSVLLDGLQIPAWGIREDIFDEIFNYKVIILGPSGAAITSEQAEKLKQFVKKGGYLILINNGGSVDGNTLLAGESAPIFGLDALVGGRAQKVEKGGYQELQKIGEECPEMSYVAVTPLPGAKVLKKDGDKVTAVRSADGHGFYIVDERFGWTYYRDLKKETLGMRELLSDIFKEIGVTSPYSISKAKEPWNMFAGILKGRDYWIAGVLNSGLKTETFNLKIHCLPPGKYRVLDVTGQRPTLKFSKEKSWYLVKDPEYQKERYLSTGITAKELSGKGLNLDAISKGGRLLLIRDVKTDVWVNMPEYEMAGLTFQYHRKKPEVDKRLDARPDKVPVTVVVGEKAPAAEVAAGEKIRRFLASKNVRVNLVKDADIPVKATQTKVEVPARPGGPASRVKETYLIEVFNNEIIDTKSQLIVIGKEETNSLVGQLAKVDAFAYDKILVKVNNQFPGKGIGVIQVVESINNEGYDPRHESRSAILIGGSDSRGMKKAVDRFLEAMKRGSALNPRAIAEKYGFGKEKRPVYVKRKKKKK